MWTKGVRKNSRMYLCVTPRVVRHGDGVCPARGTSWNRIKAEPVSYLYDKGEMPRFVNYLNTSRTQD